MNRIIIGIIIIIIYFSNYSVKELVINIKKIVTSDRIKTREYIITNRTVTESKRVKYYSYLDKNNRNNVKYKIIENITFE